jgi:hypothetical protein
MRSSTFSSERVSPFSPCQVSSLTSRVDSQPLWTSSLHDREGAQGLPRRCPLYALEFLSFGSY